MFNWVLNGYEKINDKVNKYYFDEYIYYDRDIKNLISKDENIKLSNYEMKLLELFIDNKNHIISSELIYDRVWSDLSEYNTGNIRTLIKKLRKKLPENTIETLYGGGYKLILKTSK